MLVSNKVVSPVIPVFLSRVHEDCHIVYLCKHCLPTGGVSQIMVAEPSNLFFFF